MSAQFSMQENSIRLLNRASDLDPVLVLLRDCGLFGEDELAELARTLRAPDDAENCRELWLVSQDTPGEIQGIACCVLEPMTQGTWNLQMIVVDAGRRGSGLGSSLVLAVESFVKSRKGRILVVDTSGTEGFERARAFYRKAGYREEARVHDFWGTGDDKVIFWKAL